MPLTSRSYEAQRRCFYFQKVAGFEALNFDLLWPVLSDRWHSDQVAQVETIELGDCVAFAHFWCDAYRRLSASAQENAFLRDASERFVDGELIEEDRAPGRLGRPDPASPAQSFDQLATDYFRQMPLRNHRERNLTAARGVRARPGNDGSQRTVTLLPMLLFVEVTMIAYWILFLNQTLGDLTILSHLIPILRQVLASGLNGKTPPNLINCAVVAFTLIHVCYWLNQRWFAAIRMDRNALLNRLSRFL
jgi:hypothetical protein